MKNPFQSLDSRSLYQRPVGNLRPKFANLRLSDSRSVAAAGRTLFIRKCAHDSRLIRVKDSSSQATKQKNSRIQEFKNSRSREVEKSRTVRCEVRREKMSVLLGFLTSRLLEFLNAAAFPQLVFFLK